MGKKQQKFHKAVEVIGVIAGIYLVWLTKGTDLIAQPHNNILFVFGLGNILVDGILIFSWKKR